MIDAGNFLSRGLRERLLRAELTMKALAAIHYDVLNLGPYDFVLGPDYLKRKAMEFSLPLLSSNIRIPDSSDWLNPYKILDIDDFKLGIIGLIPTNFAQKVPAPAQDLSKIEVLAPEEALKGLLPELNQKTDALLLLSQLSLNETIELLEKFPDIKIAIIARKPKRDEDLKVLSRLKDQKVFFCAPKGTSLGVMTILIKDKNNYEILDNHLIKLDKNVVMDPEINKLVAEAYFNTKERFKVDSQENLLKNLEMSPEEFFNNAPIIQKRKNHNEKDKSDKCQ